MESRSTERHRAFARGLRKEGRRAFAENLKRRTERLLPPPAVRAERKAKRRNDAAAGIPTKLTLAGQARLWSRVLLLALAVLVCVPLHYLIRLFRLPSALPKIFLGWAGWIAGARVRTIGVPLKRDVFYISNHLSWIDILALGGASGTAFVAKAEIATSPLVGWLAGLNRTVFVKRENRLGVAEQINQLRDALQENWAITVFPEGTTTDGHSLLPFKTPMLRVLEPPPPGVLVQPVLLDYGAAAEEIAWIGEETGLNNAKRILSRPGGFRLEVTFLEPFHPRDFPGRKAIAAESRRRIEEALVAKLGKPLRPFAYDVAMVGYSAGTEKAGS
jgi:1-acyl-sn-glycerol-3-phosphate acyltransferase